MIRFSPTPPPESSTTVGDLLDNPMFVLLAPAGVLVVLLLIYLCGGGDLEL